MPLILLRHYAGNLSEWTPASLIDSSIGFNNSTKVLIDADFSILLRFSLTKDWVLHNIASASSAAASVTNLTSLELKL